MSNLRSLKPWEVVEFPWGTAVKHRGSTKWDKIFLKPDGQEIDVSHLTIILHENGIEFDISHLR
jgi:hypothetical protein